MHGSGGTPIAVNTLGGLVTLAGPQSVPDGASPRCYNNDFSVGGTGTRPGLTSIYSYAGSNVGPSPGGSAADNEFGAAPWSNPGNVLLNTGVYATASLPFTSPVTCQITTVTYTAAGSILEVQFTTPVPAGLFAYTFSGLTNVTILNGQTLTPTSFFATAAFFTFPAGGSVDFGPRRDTGQASIAQTLNFTDGLNIEHFGFSIPSTSTPLGFTVSVIGYCTGAPATLTVQMLKAATPVGAIRTITLSSIPQTLILGSATDLFDSAWAYSDLNNTAFGVQLKVISLGASVVSLGYTLLTASLAPGASNFNFITTFTAQNGTVRNLSEDADGNLWVEDVTNNPTKLTLAFGGITPNARMTGINGPDVEYLTFNDGFTGSDIPRQYTTGWTDRITQVGPGQAPVFTPIAAASTTYAITSITQPSQMSDPDDSGHFQAMLWSQGPTSTAAGNVVTIFYSNVATHAAPDPVLTAAFNSGQAVYVYMSGLSSPFVNGTYQVTSVGKGIPPGAGGPRWYFTFQMPTSAYNFIGGPDTGTGFYQQTLATMNTTVPVPGLTVSNQITVTGVTPSSWNNVWTISQTLNSGQMAITETSVTSGVATFTYSLSSGVAPTTTQLVTITGTTNADGGLNLVNAVIQSATGGSSGSFTVNVSLPDATTVFESGQATTAGTKFAFDPGLSTLGTMTSPIYGSGSGGALTFAGTGQFIGVGTRQGTCHFITRNAYATAPAPPVTFTCPSNTVGISASQIPIGPPNVVARVIDFTEAGQNGVPGANFFTIPTDVKYIVNNVSYTATALVINDNTTTAATFFFTDSVLLSARAIDVYGYNLFNQIEIGNPGWVVNYSSRNFYGLCQNKVQNFNNLSFDGGFLNSIVPIPLGWTVPDVYGSLLVSPVFGNSYYIQNTTAGTLAVAGLISQAAYQDAYQQPILNANTLYSVRVTARNPSSNPSGNLVISFTSNGANIGTATLAFALFGSSMTLFTSNIINTELLTVPAATMLNVYASNIGAGADIEIDRIEIFPTAIPNLGTKVFGSYAGLPEQVDAVTGMGDFISENQQPVNGAVVMYDTFYGLKGQGPNASMYSWQASPNLEPAQWTEPEVAQRAGACGPMAFDFGEQWIVMACRNGVYLFEGGQPGKIMQEICQVWDAINWKAAETIWVKNDVTNRRLLIGIPLRTPNFWLPNTKKGGVSSVSITDGGSYAESFPDGVVAPTVVFSGPGEGASGTALIRFNPLTGTYTVYGVTVTSAGDYTGPVTVTFVGGTGSGATGTVNMGQGNPTSPNVILMCNYQGLDSGEALKGSPQMHTTMFGALNAIDMRRKWSLWEIASPYGSFVQTATDKAFYICNGQGNSKVYELDDTNPTDDGVPIDTLYTTAGLPNDGKRATLPTLGSGNVRIGYMDMVCDITGNLQVRFLPNVLLGPDDPTTGYNPWIVPGGFNGTGMSLWNRKASVNFFCVRAFVEFRGPQFDLSALTLTATKDVFSAPWGVK